MISGRSSWRPRSRHLAAAGCFDGTSCRGRFARALDRRLSRRARTQDEAPLEGTLRIGWVILIGAIVPAVAAAPVWADPETFTRHVVVAQERHAADVGREVLRRGGNAVDAAVATAFALAVTLPEAGNLGGGGFLVAYLADRREVVTVDFREMAPGAARPRMYLDRDGKPRPGYRTGAWAAAVPGTVRGLALAHARWGKRPWSELVQPAAGLARQGFALSADLAGSLNRQLSRREEGDRRAPARNDFGRLGDYPESIAV